MTRRLGHQHTKEAVVPTFSFLFTPVRRILTRALGLSFGATSTLFLGLGLSQAAPAQAALLSTGACNQAPLSQPFQRWGDANAYELVPGGSFEGSLSGWTLTGGAQRVAGSEPFGVTGSVGGSSLNLPRGASAQSPFTCVNVSYPSFRFLAQNDSLLSSVLVQVVYQTPLGPISVPVGAAALSTSWRPTLPMLTASLVGGVLANGSGTGQVALRFTSLTGATRIDDVFIDPRMR
jgi:hypothetical protein